ncbi:MAG: hypothetical protein IKZ87_03040 [Actinomycetaceae bacterium]|nr:hypothetical protein [Actinomycetaceae bacterium]
MAGKHSTSRSSSLSNSSASQSSNASGRSAKTSLASTRLSKDEVRTILRSRDTWINAAAIFLTSLIVTLSSWPIYSKMTMFITAGGAFVAGVFLGVVFSIRDTKWWKAAIVGYIAYVLVALITAVPWVYTAFPFALLDALQQVATGPLTSW